MEITSEPTLTPFIKWVGGKSKYIPEITSFFPASVDRYYEPFIGGGAIFFYLRPKKASISDVNIELINCYQVIRSDVDRLMEFLDYYKDKNSEEKYYEYRKHYNILKKTHVYSYDDYEITSEIPLDERKKICIEKASLFIFLNKIGFRGLYRENQKGEMNVPYGNNKNVSLYQKQNLLNIHKYLSTNDIIIAHHSFLELKNISSQDFVYLDPPYDQEKSSDFVAYTKDKFKQDKLFEFIKTLPCFVLSNSPTKYIQELYREYPQKILSGKRNVDIKTTKTVKEIEIIICSPGLINK